MAAGCKCKFGTCVDELGDAVESEGIDAERADVSREIGVEDCRMDDRWIVGCGRKWRKVVREEWRVLERLLTY